jgi:hypothetical protein
VLLVGALGRRLYGARVGAVTALLLATSPFAITQVHSASVDPMLATMGIVTLLAAWRLATRASAPAALAVGLAAGLNERRPPATTTGSSMPIGPRAGGSIASPPGSPNAATARTARPGSSIRGAT